MVQGRPVRDHPDPADERRGGSAILDLMVFVSGGVLLALEIVASRVIAPYFGNSIYVWGSLIGVFLAALSAGYALGGVIADRWPSRGLFAGLVIASGLLVVPVPLISPAVLDWIVIQDYGPRLSPLAAAVALFFLPSVIMGMVSPFAIRLRARALSTLGSAAGRLYALSTLGSIAGALLAAFVFLEYWGVRQILSGLALAQTAMGLAALLALRRVGPAAVAIAAIVAAAGWTAAAAEHVSARYVRDTPYHRITVTDEGDVRYLRLDDYWQSGLAPTDPRRTVFAYTDYLHLPLLLRPDARRVLMIGLGGGVVPRRYREDYPQIAVDVAELDPRVIEASRAHFGLPLDDRLRAFALDGRQFVRRAASPYDVIVVDAYLKDTLPFHLATREFYALVRSRLTKGGVMAVNVIGAYEGRRSRLFRAILKTVRQIFPTVYVFAVDLDLYPAPEGIRNLIVVATDAPAISPEEWARRAASGPVHLPGIVQAARNLVRSAIATDGVPVLSDDFAPTDALLRP